MSQGFWLSNSCFPESKSSKSLIGRISAFEIYDSMKSIFDDNSSLWCNPMQLKSKVMWTVHTLQLGNTDLKLDEAQVYSHQLKTNILSEIEDNFYQIKMPNDFSQRDLFRPNSATTITTVPFLRIGDYLMSSYFTRLIARGSSLYPVAFWLLVAHAFSPSPAFAHSNPGEFTLTPSSQGPSTNIKSAIHRNWIHASQGQAGIFSSRSGFDQRRLALIGARADSDRNSKAQVGGALRSEQHNSPSLDMKKAGRLPRSDRASPEGNGGGRPLPLARQA
jgi:hypothetical protein